MLNTTPTSHSNQIATPARFTFEQVEELRATAGHELYRAYVVAVELVRRELQDFITRQQSEPALEVMPDWFPTFPLDTRPDSSAFWETIQDKLIARTVEHMEQHEFAPGITGRGLAGLACIDLDTFASLAWDGLASHGLNLVTEGESHV